MVIGNLTAKNWESGHEKVPESQTHTTVAHDSYGNKAAWHAVFHPYAAAGNERGVHSLQMDNVYPQPTLQAVCRCIISSEDRQRRQEAEEKRRSEHPEYYKRDPINYEKTNAVVDEMFSKKNLSDDERAKFRGRLAEGLGIHPDADHNIWYQALDEYRTTDMHRKENGSTDREILQTYLRKGGKQGGYPEAQIQESLRLVRGMSNEEVRDSLDSIKASQIRTIMDDAGVRQPPVYR